MKLNQITVSSLDVNKAVTFYQKLGLELIVHSSEHYARFVCENGISFSIHQVEELPQGNGTWIYFEFENLDNSVKKLQKKGFIFKELPNDKPWLWREARLRDLDHNLIILFHAGENRLNPPWKIKK